MRRARTREEGAPRAPRAPSPAVSTRSVRRAQRALHLAGSARRPSLRPLPRREPRAQSWAPLPRGLLWRRRPRAVCVPTYWCTARARQAEQWCTTRCGWSTVARLRWGSTRPSRLAAGRREASWRRRSRLGPAYTRARCCPTASRRSTAAPRPRWAPQRLPRHPPPRCRRRRWSSRRRRESPCARHCPPGDTSKPASPCCLTASDTPRHGTPLARRVDTFGVLVARVDCA
mmetsp:Transcript_77274/g.208798  ORF Transcript_77274/g.208798 Transcript_77274/m.208798 type:complete len:230 (+) Transcript_77274:826-1515(+)